jgi:Fibronectin type III domain
MKLTQKTKYFIFGVIATAVLIPLGSYAVKTIPLTFAEGDVLSASVMNALLKRIEIVTSPITADDLVGTWSLTQYMPITGQPSNANCLASNNCTIVGATNSPDGMTRMRTDTVVIAKNGSTYTFTQSSYTILGGSSLSSAPTGTLGVVGESVLTKYFITDNTSAYYLLWDAKKKTPDQIVLTNRVNAIEGSLGLIGTAQSISTATNLHSSFNIVVLDRKNTPPAPAEALSATVNSSGGVALTWTDQSTDETGFKVQYKTSTKGSWTTATTTASNSTSYTLNGLSAGTYWIRVVAANSYGDAMSSSEVQAVVPTTSTFTSTTTSSIMTSTTTSSISGRTCIANC